MVSVTQRVSSCIIWRSAHYHPHPSRYQRPHRRSAAARSRRRLTRVLRRPERVAVSSTRSKRRTSGRSRGVGRRPAAPQRRGAAAKGAKESLVDLAYREIRRRILDNEYPPSHQVLELELAGELGMSRTPVREAMIRLKNEKFIQVIPRHGMRVVPLSLDELRDVYEVLTALGRGHQRLSMGPTRDALRSRSVDRRVELAVGGDAGRVSRRRFIDRSSISAATRGSRPWRT